MNLKCYNFPSRIGVAALGDAHFGSKECDVELLQKKIDWIKSRKDVRVILMGDLLNCGTRYSVGAGNYDDDFNPHEQYDKMVEMLKPIRKQVLTSLQGNHERRIYEISSFDVSKLMAKELQFPYASDGIALLKLRVGKQNYTVAATHGSFSGKTIQGKMGGCLKLNEFIDADLYCFDEDTEVLTKKGFKKYFDLKIGEEIFNLNLDSEYIESDNIQNIIKYKTEKINELKTKIVQMNLTENHRVIYKYKNKWLVDTVKNIKSKKGQIKIPLAAQIINKVPLKIKINEAKLIGWLISEGHFRKDQNLIQIFQKNKENINEINKLLKKLKYKFSKNKRKDGMTVFNIFSKDAKQIRTKLINKKQIPDYCINFNKTQFNAMLDTLIKGDGHKHNNKNMVYYSKNEELIDKLQSLCVINNYRTKKVSRKHGFSNNIQYELVINSNPNTEITLSRVNFKEKKYDGFVWCASTTNGTLIVRKNGRVFISGNCYGHVHALAHNIQLYRKVNYKNKTIDESERHFVLTGSFLNFDSSYGETKGYSPLKKGMPTIWLNDKKQDVQVEM